MPTADSCTEPAAVICCSFLFGAASYFETAPSHFLWRITGNWCILFHRLNNAAGETAVLSGREAVDGVVNIDLNIDIEY